MSDWDTTTRIGQKHKGGATPRETTIKGGSALNAAQRQGLVVGTDKKYATGNAVCDPCLFFLFLVFASPHSRLFHNVLTIIQAKSLGSDGQRMTMVDRNNEGPVKPKEVGTQIADVIKRRRNEEPYKMTQKELAAKCSTTPAIVQGLETGRGQPDQKALSAISRVLNVHLSGSQLGQPKFGPKNKDKAPANKK